ncbi:MAG: DUF1641 domain-containing protein [Anaerolineales bacterium]
MTESTTLSGAPMTQEQFNLLLERLDRIEAHLAEQRRRTEELEELKRDLIPIANQMVHLTIDELAEIGSEFRVEDLFFLLKRLLRDTYLLLDALDQLESLMGLSEEIKRLMKPMFNTLVEELDRLERRGYFAMLGKSWQVLTAPVPEEQTSLFALLKVMGDPQTRKGLARALSLLKLLGEVPSQEESKN